MKVSLRHTHREAYILFNIVYLLPAAMAKVEDRGHHSGAGFPLPLYHMGIYFTHEPFSWLLKWLFSKIHFTYYCLCGGYMLYFRTCVSWSVSGSQYNFVHFVLSFYLFEFQWCNSGYKDITVSTFLPADPSCCLKKNVFICVHVLIECTWRSKNNMQESVLSIKSILGIQFRLSGLVARSCTSHTISLAHPLSEL